MGLFFIVLILLIGIDNWVSFEALGYDQPLPQASIAVLSSSLVNSSNRTVLLDRSSLGSFPGFYLSYNDMGKSTKQVFGSGWQGASTAQNLVWLNTALEKGWYSYVFDRSLEMGGDTVTILKKDAGDVKSLINEADRVGYRPIDETDKSLTFK